MSENIEVHVAGDLVRIRYRDRDAIVVAADADNERLNVALDTEGGLEWVDEVVAKDPVTVTIHRTPLTLAPMPRPQPTPAGELHLLRRPEAPARPVSTTKVRQARRVVDVDDHISEAERDEILDQVIKSWQANPRQSSQETSEESHRIAKEVLGDDDHHSVMQVAGVRAALARGVYDHLDEVSEIRGYNA